jgi:hypothetical protein
MPIAGMRPRTWNAGTIRYDMYRDMDRETKYYYPQNTRRDTRCKKINSSKKRRRKGNKTEKRRKSKRRY